MSNPQEQSPRATGPQLSKEQTEGVKYTPGPELIKQWEAEVTKELRGSITPSYYHGYLAAKHKGFQELSRVEGERDELRECLLRVQKAYNEAPSGWLPTKELNLAMVAIHVALYGNTEERPANQVKG